MVGRQRFVGQDIIYLRLDIVHWVEWVIGNRTLYSILHGHSLFRYAGQDHVIWHCAEYTLLLQTTLMIIVCQATCVLLA